MVGCFLELQETRPEPRLERITGHWVMASMHAPQSKSTILWTLILSSMPSVAPKNFLLEIPWRKPFLMSIWCFPSQGCAIFSKTWVDSYMPLGIVSMQSYARFLCKALGHTHTFVPDDNSWQVGICSEKTGFEGITLQPAALVTGPGPDLVHTGPHFLLIGISARLLMPLLVPLRCAFLCMTNDGVSCSTKDDHHVITKMIQLIHGAQWCIVNLSAGNWPYERKWGPCVTQGLGPGSLWSSASRL